MMKAVNIQSLILVIFLISGLNKAAIAETDHQHGTTKTENGGLWAWDTKQQSWVSPNQFWHNYAAEKGGFTYGPTQHYPPYEQLNEGDTLLIQTAKGECLMEFFHSRWRRANDVRRWDPAFNDYAGCPHVFD